MKSSLDAEAIGRLLAGTKKIVITTHTNPDGDAMGSSLGLSRFLRERGHSVDVITPTPYPAFLHWMAGHAAVHVYSRDEKSKEKAHALIDNAEVIFSLDYNDPRRIEGLGERLLSAKAVKILIDHHPDPVDFADYALSDTSASSTAELVFRFIAGLGGEGLVNSDTADCLYTGIMTDTGSFRFAATSAQTHLITAKLLQAGANHVLIHDRIHGTCSEHRMRLLGHSLKEKLVVLKEFRTAYIALTRKELVSFHYKNGDTEGIVNYATALEGIVMGVLFLERDKQVKISFRSRGTFPVNDIARDHFEGGGHRNAAGGVSNLPLDGTVKKFVGLLAGYKEKLL